VTVTPRKGKKIVMADRHDNCLETTIISKASPVASTSIREFRYGMLLGANCSGDKKDEKCETS